MKALQDALGTTTKNKATLRDRGLAAARASGWRDARPRVEGEQDLLVVLQQAGFVGFDAVGRRDHRRLPGRGAGVVLVVGNERIGRPRRSSPCPRRRRSTRPRCRWWWPSVWAEVDRRSRPRRRGAADPRQRRSRRTVSTVDDLDLAEGPTTVVLAMSDLFLRPPVVGPLRLRAQRDTLARIPITA